MRITRCRSVATGCIALAVIVLGLIISARLGRENKHAFPGPGNAGALAPEAASSAETPDPLVAGSVEDAVGEAVRQAATETYDIPGGTLEVSKANISVLKGLATERRQEIARKRRGMFQSLEPYFTAQERLREEVMQKYGSPAEAATPEVLQTVARLEEAFWDRGDFGSEGALRAIYEARAILDVALEERPDDPELLKAMVEVHMSGWPVNNGIEESFDDPLYLTKITRSMEISDYLWRLWTVEISRKRPKELDFQEIAYIYDFANYSANVSPEAVERLKKYLETPGTSVPDGFKARFATLSSGRQVAPKERIQALDAAIERAANEGGEWWRYTSAFTRARGQLVEQGFVDSWDIFPVFIDTYYEEARNTQPYEDFRYTLWRGTAFKGPRSRQERLVPISVYNERLAGGRP